MYSIDSLLITINGFLSTNLTPPVNKSYTDAVQALNS